MPVNLDGIICFTAVLIILFVLQRSLHREIQAILLLLTRRIDLSIALFSILFFPGVLLHEGSHYLMARLIGVRTGRLSLLPRPVGDGKLQLGYVETAPTDTFRDALIGMAPMLTGGGFVAYAGLYKLQLLELGKFFPLTNVKHSIILLQGLIARPDFWLWVYLALVVSSTMMPSESDRRAWIPLGLVLATLMVLALTLGAGPWMIERLSRPFDQLLKAAASVFLVSALLHLTLLPFVWLFRQVLGKALGLKVML